MRRRAFGIAVLCALPLLGQPVDAAGSTPRLRVSGRTTAFVDVTLRAGVRFDQINARITVRRGTYAAWWMTRLGETPSASGNQAGATRWVDPQDAAATYPSSVFGFRSEPMAAGRYRVYLATDGEATIDVPAPGLHRSLDLRPSRRTTSAAVSAPLTVAAGGVVADDHRTSLRLAPTALVVSSVETVAQRGVTVEGLTACLARPGEGCTGPTSARGHTSSLVGDHSARFSSSYLPGQAPAGRVDAVQRAEAGPGVLRATANVFYLVTVP